MPQGVCQAKSRSWKGKNKRRYLDNAILMGGLALLKDGELDKAGGEKIFA